MFDFLFLRALGNFEFEFLIIDKYCKKKDELLQYILLICLHIIKIN